MSVPYQGSSDEEKKKELEALKEKYLRVYLTPEARYRLNNLKLVGNQTAVLLEDQIFQLALQGKLDHQITDEELKELLIKLQNTKKEIRIRW
ncbi:MAG: DNA-binding protein [Nitrososphaeria archaeon]|nr:DNA-binding protein [Conexivisphaerales archaeon]